MRFYLRNMDHNRNNFVNYAEKLQTRYNRDLRYISNEQIREFLQRLPLEERGFAGSRLAEVYQEAGISRRVLKELAQEADNPILEKSDESIQVIMQKVSQNLKISKYSPKTIKQYLFQLEKFHEYLRSRGSSLTSNVPDQLMADYMEQLIDSGQSESYLSGYRSAMQAWFFIQKQNRDFSFMRKSRKAKRLPVVLTRNEIFRILEEIANPKHWVAISLMYSAGLRVSEVAKLRIQDVDLESGVLVIRQGKGKKDRLSVFSEKQKMKLIEVIAGRKGREFLIVSGHDKKKALSIRSLQMIFQRSLERAGIQKPASCHSLRHSFATHLLENGTDIRHIQKLLGHANIRTTSVYTKVTTENLKKIQSPF